MSGERAADYGTLRVRMRDGRRGRLGGLCALIALLVVQGAGADNDSVRIEYHAPEECIDGAGFLHEALARTKHGRLASRHQLAMQMTVIITTEGEQTVGRLVFTDVNGQQVLREVKAVSCAELVPALALVTALAIDAQVAKYQAESWDVSAVSAAPTEVEPEPAPVSVASQPAAPATPVPMPQTPAELGYGQDDRGITEGQTEASPQAGVRWIVGAQAVLVSAVAPVAAYGGEAFVDLGPAHGGWTARSGLAYARRGDTGGGVGRANFDWIALRADFCPVSPDVGPVAVFPCAALEAGWLHAKGLRDDVIVEASSEWDPWLALGALARLQVALSEVVVTELQGGAVFPLTRWTYQFENPDTDVHEIPAVGWAVAAGLGLRFL